jgi:hypothetical protein
MAFDYACNKDIGMMCTVYTFTFILSPDERVTLYAAFTYAMIQLGIPTIRTPYFTMAQFQEIARKMHQNGYRFQNYVRLPRSYFRMKNDKDDDPIAVDTSMVLSKIKWNPSGTIIAVAGSSL